MQKRDGCQQGDHHADRGDLVAAPGGLGGAQLDQADDEQDGGKEIGERNPDRHLAVFSGGVFSVGLASLAG